jgi:hypothetical protein
MLVGCESGGRHSTVRCNAVSLRRFDIDCNDWGGRRATWSAHCGAQKRASIRATPFAGVGRRVAGAGHYDMLMS